MKTLKIEMDFDNEEQLKSFVRVFEDQFCGTIHEKKKENHYRVNKK